MKVWVTATALLFVAIIAWLAWQGDQAKQGTAVVGAAAVVAAAIFGAAITQGQIKARDIREAHRLQKAEVYEAFSDLYLETLQTAKIKPGSPELSRAQEKVVEHMLEFSKRSMLWASPDVLLAYKRFRETANGTVEKREVLLRVDDVLQAMREDLELGNSGLVRGDLVKLYLSDPGSLDGL